MNWPAINAHTIRMISQTTKHSAKNNLGSVDRKIKAIDDQIESTDSFLKMFIGVFVVIPVTLAVGVLLWLFFNPGQ